MKLLKLLPAALLMSFSLGAYAQAEDELLATIAEEPTEVLVPTSSTQNKFFHRLQVGYTGTLVKYTNFGLSPDYNNYYLSGVSIGWMGDFSIAKSIPLYLELGASFAYHTGRSQGDSIYQYHNKATDLGEGEYTSRHYRIQAFSLTIPVTVNYQFRDIAGIKDFTLAPFAGVYARFNICANRWETKYTTEYFNGVALGEATVSRENKSLMSDERNGGWWDHKLHVGKLAQVGAQIGLNAYYKNYSFGVAYMRDLTPFAAHSSSPELTTKPTDQGGNLPNIGTNCDEKVSTANNFAVTFGYIF